jgi:hypothetical protein
MNTLGLGLMLGQIVRAADTMATQVWQQSTFSHWTDSSLVSSDIFRDVRILAVDWQ